MSKMFLSFTMQVILFLTFFYKLILQNLNLSDFEDPEKGFGDNFKMYLLPRMDIVYPELQEGELKKLCIGLTQFEF